MSELEAPKTETDAAPANDATHAENVEELPLKVEPRNRIADFLEKTPPVAPEHEAPAEEPAAPAAEAPEEPTGPAAGDETAGVVTPARRVPSRVLSVHEMGAGVAAILLWIILVGAGILVTTVDCFKAFDGSTNPDTWTIIRCWWTFLTCYTYTNVGLLCCLSAFIGAIGLSAHIDGNRTESDSIDRRTFYMAAIIRGFFCYIVILAGLIFVGEMTDKEHQNISIEQYMKLAGAVSVISFAIGYSPNLFQTFFGRVLLFINGKTGAGDTPVPATER